MLSARKRLAFLLVFMSILSACGDRIPTPKTAHDKIQKYFVKYGKKYRTSDFGRSKVSRVEIIDIREIQKNIISTEAKIIFDEGKTHHVLVTLVKKPFGWKTISWENLGEL